MWECLYYCFNRYVKYLPFFKKWKLHFFDILIENHELWGTGSNKYGQLGRCRKTYHNFREFILLNIESGDDKIKDIKCREWSSCVYV